MDEVQIRIPAKELDNRSFIIAAIANKLKLTQSDIKDFRILKKSIDARQKLVFIQLKLLVGLDGVLPNPPVFSPNLIQSQNKLKVLIIGAGPAGLFAALKALELGFQPIVLERGKKVRERRRDLAKINKEQIVNPESNYCFGEGGAGTYSDGKLYTRSNKRGDINGILNWLIYFGADEQIGVEAHPHIGTNKLPKIIENIREFILNHGGEIHFNAKVTDFEINNSTITGAIVNNSDFYQANEVILATGHSSRDIFELLDRKNVTIENKPFALGVRVEHPQKVIDLNQYDCDVRPDYLPPAAYSLVTQTKDKPVFSFCMCPGGIIAPCATNPGEIVTNGWSPSKRNNPFANSGIVVPIDESDWVKYKEDGNLAALSYQKSVEKKAFEFGGGGQIAPAQRLMDFVNNKYSQSLPVTSYQPGIQSVLTDEVLPKNIVSALRSGFKDFGKKIKNYLSNEAVIHLTESRTSSPVRIPRDKITLEHPQIKGLYPCGEGAGYAGGIMSAAIDGQKCIEAIHKKIGA